jgi:cyanophycinase-like exopeptidase
VVNILLNINNFGDDFAFYELKRYIRSRHRVLIIPFSYHEDYIRNVDEFTEHFSKSSPEIQEIVREFSRYGIRSKNIRILNYYTDSEKTIQSKFKHSDILFFTGGYPDRALYRIDTLGIRDYILNFQGIVMGTSAGAMIQIDKYHLTPENDEDDYDYHDGLGLLSGFDIEVHFEANFLHLAGLLTALKLNQKPIYVMPNDGGLIVHDGNVTPIGNTFVLTVDDIDDIEEALAEVMHETY